MKRNTAKPAQTVKPRIVGESAIRIQKLAAKTGLSESQIANFAVTAGLAAVEARWK